MRIRIRIRDLVRLKSHKKLNFKNKVYTCSKEQVKKYLRFTKVLKPFLKTGNHVYLIILVHFDAAGSGSAFQYGSGSHDSQMKADACGSGSGPSSGPLLPRILPHDRQAIIPIFLTFHKSCHVCLDWGGGTLFAPDPIPLPPPPLLVPPASLLVTRFHWFRIPETRVVWWGKEKGMSVRCLCRVPQILIIFFNL